MGDDSPGEALIRKVDSADMATCHFSQKHIQLLFEVLTMFTVACSDTCCFLVCFCFLTSCLGSFCNQFMLNHVVL